MNFQFTHPLYLWLLPVALAGVLGCPHPQPSAVPGGPEPELRVGLAVGLTSVRLGGDGELFITDDGNGQPVGAIAPGSVWTISVDSNPGFTFLRPDGTRTERHLGVSAVASNPLASQRPRLRTAKVRATTA